MGSSIHSRIRCHMNTVQSRDSVVPSDRTLMRSHSGHTALTHGMMRDSRSERIFVRPSAPLITSTDA